MKNTLLLIVAILALSFTIDKTTDIKTVRFDKARSTITYTMVHPLHTWEGVSKEIDGLVQSDTKSGNIIKVAAVAKVASFDSKNSNRDSHMMEVTEAIKYPTVSFVTTSVKDDGATLDVTGKITLHNVTKEIHFVAASKTEDKKRILSGNFIVLLEDFKIDRHSFMMVKTDNEMKMAFYLEYPL